MSLTLASIHVYPIKSVGGFRLPVGQLTDRGLRYDRRWMLVDERGTFVSQRTLPAMACLHTAPLHRGFRVLDRRSEALISIPWKLTKGPVVRVTVWSDAMEAIEAPPTYSAWFSERLGRTLRLVHMPEASHRTIDPATGQGITSFSDSHPYLIISQASLDALNARLEVPLPMDRFRPNLVIAGGEAFQEDGWQRIRIGTAGFDVVKACARCVITTTDQDTGQRGPEPLRALSLFRRRGNDVLFGMDAIADASGTVRAGDAVAILATRVP